MLVHDASGPKADHKVRACMSSKIGLEQRVKHKRCFCEMPNYVIPKCEGKVYSFISQLNDKAWRCSIRTEKFGHNKNAVCCGHNSSILQEKFKNRTPCTKWQEKWWWNALPSSTTTFINFRQIKTEVWLDDVLRTMRIWFKIFYKLLVSN